MYNLNFKLTGKNMIAKLKQDTLEIMNIIVQMYRIFINLNDILLLKPF